MGAQSRVCPMDFRGDAKGSDVETPIAPLRLAFMEYQEAEFWKKWSPAIDQDAERKEKLEMVCAERWAAFEKLLRDSTNKA